MVIGIISEAAYDCEALGVIVKKIIGNHTVIVPASKSGKDAIIHQKKVLVSKVLNFDCEVVFIVRDSDGKSIQKIERALKEAYDTTPINSRYQICIAIQELEAWFLGDLDSIRITYTLPKNSSKIPESNVDAIQNPKEKLKSYILKESKGKAQYIPSDTIRMADNINIEKARTKSASFNNFYQVVSALT